MKLKCELEIDTDRDTVWAAFDNRANVSRWQPEIQSIELVSGEYNKPGAKSRILYLEDGRERTITEYVTERREPEFLALRSETVSGSAVSVNRFERLDGDRTRWVVYVNHSFRGLMRLVGPFFKAACLRRIDGYMQRFKLMVESAIEEGKQ